MFQNGLLSALPYLTNGVMNFPMAFVSDKLLSSGRLSKTTVRKIFNTIGFGGPAVALTWIAFEKCNSTRVIIALCVSLGLNSGAVSGFLVSMGLVLHWQSVHLWQRPPSYRKVVFTDVAPNYSGTLVGISNTFANTTGFISPIIVGILTEGNVRPEWMPILNPSI